MANEEVKGMAVKLALDDSSFSKGMNNLKKQMKVIDSGFKASVAGVKNWGSTLDGLKANSTALGEKISVQKQIVQAYTSQLEKQKATLDKNITTMTNLKEKLDTTKAAYEQSRATLGKNDEATKKLKNELDGLNQKYTASENAVVKAKSSIDGYTIQLNKATGNLNSMKAELSDTNTKIKDFGEESDDAGNKSKELGDKSSKAIDTLSSALAAAGVVASIKQITEALKDATDAATTFEAGIAKIETLADTSVVSMDDIKSSITNLSNETGKSTADLSEATYQAISAGVDTSKAVGFVAASTKLAEGGFTDATTTVDVLTSAINAYGLSAQDATSISDMLITTQNLGKTTVNELAENMGTVIPIAAAYGVQMDNLSSAFVTITKNGIKTAEAGTYIRGMLTELGDTSSEVSTKLKEETGKTFAELTADGKSLGDVLQILGDSVDGDSTAFSNLWGNVRAGTGALSIFNTGAQDFNKTLDFMQSSAGSTAKAYQIMENTSKHAQEKMTTAAANFKTAVGNQLLPTLTEIEEAGADAFDWVSAFVEANPEVVSMVSALVVAVGTLVTAIVGYAAKVKIAAFVTSVFNAALESNPAIIVATAITTVIAAIGTYILTLPKATNETKEYIESLKATNEESQKAIDAIHTNTENTESQIKALQELSAKENKSATDKQSILSLVDQLNAAVPNLSLAYDEQTDSLNLTASAITALAQAQAEQQLQEQYVSNLTDRYVAQQELVLKLEEANKNLADSKAALAKMDAMGASAAVEYGSAYEEAREAVAYNQHAVEELTEAQEENEASIKKLNDEIEEKTNTAKDDTHATDNQIKSTGELTKALDEQQESEKALTSAMDTASEALKEQAENGTLSLSTINSLIDAGYAAALSVDTETGAVTLNKSAYIELTRAKLKTQIADLELLKTDIQAKLVDDGKAAIDTAGDFAVLAGAKSLANDADYVSYQSTSAQIAALTTLKDNLEKTATSFSTYSRHVSSASSSTKRAADKAKKAAEEAARASEKAYTELFTKLKEQYSSGEIDLKDFIAKSETLRDTYLKGNKEKWTECFDDMFDEITETESNRLKEIQDNYDEAMSDIQDKIDDMKFRLFDVGGLTETVKINDSEITKLSNLDKQTESITAFGDALQSLKDRGISADMLSEIASMDVKEGTETANLLLGLSDEEWAKEMAAWDEKQAAAKEIAERYYQDDVNTLKTNLVDAVTELQSDMTNSGLELGGNLTDGLVAGIDAGTLSVTKAMEAMMAKAIAAAKKTAKIASPSRVMKEEVGKQLTAGTSQGIEDGTPEVSDSMSVMMGNIIAQAKSLRVQAAGAISTLTTQVAESPPSTAPSAKSSGEMLTMVNALLAGISRLRTQGTTANTTQQPKLMLDGVECGRALFPYIVQEAKRLGVTISE